MINYRIIVHILGILLLVEGFFMLLSALVGAFYHDGGELSLVVSAGMVTATGAIAWISTRRSSRDLGKREGYFIVTLGWVLFSLFGTLPFILSGFIPNFTDAFFETISGFTTTGASILTDIESMPHGLLFWRSLTQWLGGMGIIVLTLAILPVLGVGGMQLFIAEVPGVTYDKLHPRIRETAKRLWTIYIIFTLSEAVLLTIGGMDLFDAVCHSFTTMATGGYSTKQASIAHWNSPFIHYVITLFMFLAGTNFMMSYFALHLRFGKIFRNEEFRFYLGSVLFFALVIAIGLWMTMECTPEKCIRDALFQVVSIITTTGYVTADYLTWLPFLTVLIFIMMFFGGSAGSTGGGVKIVRILLLLKNSFLELKRLIHPNAVIPVRYNGKPVSAQVISNVLAFAFFYLIIIISSVAVMSAMGYDMDSSFGAVAASLGNIGPGLGAVGPSETYAHIPDVGKWFLSFLMLVGRLELFTVIIILSPAFYRK